MVNAFTCFRLVWSTRCILLGVLCWSAHAQPLQVTPGGSATQLAGALAGTGVTIQNASYTGAIDASGLFQNTNSGFPIRTGIVLTTGLAGLATGPGFNLPTWVNGTEGNLWATTTAGAASEDAVVLAFDVIPSGNRLSFRYVFGSEEYPEFVGSLFNDVFGLLISGPGIAGRQNLAVIPGTSTPISIANVNGGNPFDVPPVAPTNPLFYVDNSAAGGPVFTTVAYDGLTVLLEAVATVQPCQTYRIELIVADVGDATVDSGVFLEAGSFTSNLYAVRAENSLNASILAENCGNSQQLAVTRSGDLSQPAQISWTLGGSATAGLDYSLGVASPQTLAPGQATLTIPVTVLDDALVEGEERLELNLFSESCGSRILALRDTFVLRDFQPLQVTAPASLRFCTTEPGKVLEALVSGGYGNYTYSWGAASPGNTNRIEITAPGSYTLRVRDSCRAGEASLQASRTIVVSFWDLPTARDTSFVSCGPGTVTLRAPNVRGGRPPFTYRWGSSGSFGTIDTQNVSLTGPSLTQALTIRDQCGVTVDLTLGVLDGTALIQRYLLEATQCFVGHRIQFGIAGGDTVAAVYSWNFGPGASLASYAGALPPPITYSTPGAHRITLSITLDNDCIYSTAYDILLTLPEEVGVRAVPSCVPYRYDFEIERASPGAPYRWLRVGTGAGQPPVQIGQGARISLTDSLANNLQLVVENAANPCTRVEARFPLFTPSLRFLPAQARAQLNAQDYVDLSFTAIFDGDPVEYRWRIGGQRGQSYLGERIVARLDSTGLYDLELTATDRDGCAWQARCTGCIQVLGKQLRVPNAFSPNADGLNDYWPGRAEVFFPRIVQHVIYDYWGNQVYRGAGAWDGTVEGKTPAPEGAYVYSLQLENGEVLTGTVTLIR
ncbi:MAG: choice-of-anchor L domain-containing protein [Bacteroidetes bacterium]|jgi:gliding motility-associated-like protein|nr:choice-of-anchor L domain-containing protein [Bacteroidota bacterium]